MQNAHLRLGRLEYIKPAVSSKSTATHVTVTMDRLIVEAASDEKQAPQCHLLSVFGGEQEIAAIHAAIADQANFRIAGPDLSPMVVSLGEHAHVFRGLIQAPGRRQPVRHLVAVSHALFETQAGANSQADRTVVYSAEAEFLVYRLGVRFGIPLLPCWSSWIRAELTRQNRVHPLLALGCNPVLVEASKQELLDLIAGAAKRGVLSIPDKPLLEWSVPRAFAGDELGNRLNHQVMVSVKILSSTPRNQGRRVESKRGNRKKSADHVKTNPACAYFGPVAGWILDRPARNLLINLHAGGNADRDYGGVAQRAGRAELSRRCMNAKCGGKHNTAQNRTHDNNGHVWIEGSIRVLV